MGCDSDDVDDAASMPESRAVVGRLQRQMLALLPHYCISDLQQQQHRLRLAASVALATACEPSTTGTTAELDDMVAVMLTHVYDVLSNIVRMCTSLVTTSGKRKYPTSCLLRQFANLSFRRVSRL